MPDGGALGERIRALRKARGMSATQLAAEAELHRSRLSRIEHGTVCNVSVDAVKRIARALGVAPSVLLDTGPVSVPQARRTLVDTSTDPLGRDIYVIEAASGDLRHYEVMVLEGGYTYSWVVRPDRYSALREAELIASGE